MKFPRNLLDNVYNNMVGLKSKIEQRLSSLKLQDPFSDPDRLNDNAASDTDAKEESSHERMEALEKVLKSQLEEINLALERINKGTYGKCLNCGKTISPERLAIKPSARYCVDCERKKEK
ncbi:MAG: TraR/DksA family transcriptional regulator [Candidatus Gottesmanbacteria bacterium GW2011_GWA2_43_14]|uniref:TraR/DksA family transcriptional regulator n=1 Tax=Candidatus Gottesmanbacteria bacterium GW2011_GWA2_43_14 TaxID=1618443 RepID=A0A0G1FNU9_9BACT|nr:MAG: TraR/DksA family transcriptional regulator [Candidatus Gottesmanbacteria bacterium GW2011_GWA2_43_14]